MFPCEDAIGMSCSICSAEKRASCTLPVNCKLFVSYFFEPSKVSNRPIYFSVPEVKEMVSVAKIICPVFASSTRGREEDQLTHLW